MNKIILSLFFSLIFIQLSFSGIIANTLQIGDLTIDSSGVITNATINGYLPLTGGIVQGDLHIHDGGHVDPDNRFTNALFHLYGTNDNIDATDEIQYRASMVIDGHEDIDKNLVFADAGVAKWAWQTYRNEEGKYFYLYNIKNTTEPIVISESGRFGVNKRSNISDYHANTAIGTDEIAVEGIYESVRSRIYKFTIIATNELGDSYSVSNSFDNISYTVSSGYASNYITAAYSNFANTGLSVKFGSTNGHELGDTWYYFASAQLPEGSFTVSARKLNEFLLTTNRHDAEPVFEDKSFDINSKEFGDTPLLESGTTNGTFYIGTLIWPVTLYFNLVTNGVGCQMLYQYWNGTAWTKITSIEDNTLNLTQSGELFINATNYATGPVVSDYDTNRYYWIRGFSTNAVTVNPVAKTISPHGKNRFMVYGSHADLKPALEVDGNGDITIGDYTLTESTIQSFYWKFLCSFNTNQTLYLLTNALTPVIFSNELSDVYNKFTDYKWYPNSTTLHRSSGKLTISLIGNNPATTVGINVYLIENENITTPFAQIYSIISKIGTATETLTANLEYPFIPTISTNSYSIYVEMTNISNVTIGNLINYNKGNRWFGEKLQ